jgi:hypothetical protein
MLKMYFSYPRLPSWTGGVPRLMSEANLARRGGGLPTVRDPVILSEARDLHHPGSRHSLRSVWIHPSCPGGESFGYLFHNTFVSNSENVITFF